MKTEAEPISETSCLFKI